MSPKVLATLIPALLIASNAQAEEHLTNEGASATSGREHPLGLQTLFVERSVTGKNTNRKGPLLSHEIHFQFDHTRNRAWRLHVDAATGKVLERQALDTVHLPLSTAEIAWATALIAADDELLERLRDEQRADGRAVFEHVGELDMKAIIHEPTDASDPCAHERCALIALFDQSRTVFSIEPVVHFASARIRLPESR